jgi:hypothetical protein
MHFGHKKDETASNIEYLRTYPVVAADALFAVGMDVIPSVLLIGEHL